MRRLLIWLGIIPGHVLDFAPTDGDVIVAGLAFPGAQRVGVGVGEIVFLHRVGWEVDVSFDGFVRRRRRDDLPVDRGGCGRHGGWWMVVCGGEFCCGVFDCVRSNYCAKGALFCST